MGLFDDIPGGEPSGSIDTAALRSDFGQQPSQPASERFDLDPSSKDLLVRTVIGEAANQGDDGLAAVTHSILNRKKAGRYGENIQQIVLAKSQYEPWGTRATELMTIRPDSAAYKRASSVVDRVLAGETPDPTGGMTHFLNPDIVMARSGKLPKWAQGKGVRIGDHVFLSPDGDPIRPGNAQDAITAQMRQPAAAPQAQPATMAFSQEQPIDRSRPIINNADGSFSTERTITVGFDDGFVNIPTIVGGKQVSPEEAVALHRAGQNPAVGKFSTQQEAEAAARSRSEQIGQVRGAEAAPPPSPGSFSSSSDKGTITVTPGGSGNAQRQAPPAQPTPPGAQPAAAGGLFDDIPAATFRERHAGEGSAIPEKAKELGEGLRRTADKRIIDESGMGAADTFIGEALNTAFLNIPRNVEAGLKTVTSGKSFGDEYEDAKARDEALARQNPVASTAGTVTGVVAGAATLPGIGGGATMTARAARAAATGAAYAGASELFDSKDPVHAAVAAGLGAAIGGVAAPVAERIFGLVAGMVKAGRTKETFLKPDGTLTDEAVKAAKEAGIDPADLQLVMQRKYAENFGKRGATPATARDTAADEFGIKLSPGEAANDFNQIAHEQSMAKGVFGDKATKEARGFFDDRFAQVDRAKTAIQERHAGAQPMVDNPIDASNAAAAALKSEAGRQKAGFKNAYDDALSREGEFSDIAFRDVGERIRRKGLKAPEPVVINDVTTPIAARAIQHLDANIGRVRVQDRAEPRSREVITAGRHQFPGEPARISGPAQGEARIESINLRGVDQARKELVAFYQAAKSKGDASDIRAMQRIIDGFDDELETAITTGLFKGDEAAYPALKEARRLYKEYRRAFTPQASGDSVGKAMQKIVERDASGGDIVNLLIGKNAIGEKGDSLKLAQHIKKTLGENSEEWSAIKQALWLRLTSKPEGVDDFGPQALSQRIFKFVNGDGIEMSRAMFSPAEVAEMKRFATVLKSIVPPPGTVNHSNTFYALARDLGIGSGLGGAGFLFTNDPTTAAGLASLKLGGRLAKDAYRGRQARKYFEGGVKEAGVPQPQASRPIGAGAGLLTAAEYQGQ